MKNTILKYVCGIDCGKGYFDACLMKMDHSLDLKIKATHKYANGDTGFKELNLWPPRSSGCLASGSFGFESSDSRF